MSYRNLLVAAGLSVALVGCATKPQRPVEFNARSIAGSPAVGVSMTKLPKPEVHLPGANCLLCAIAASAANMDLSRHTDTLTTEDLAQLKEDVARALKGKGATVKVIAEELDISALPDGSAIDGAPKKNFAPLKQKYGVDRLLVLEVNQLGFERTYSAYIPTSDPKGLFRGVGYMVDLGTNKYDWYQPINVLKSADGKWDEPTRFPGLTNAYFQAIEIGKDSLVKPFAK